MFNNYITVCPGNIKNRKLWIWPIFTCINRTFDTGHPIHVNWLPLRVVRSRKSVYFVHSRLIRVHIIGPPSHWSPISLVPHLIGPPSHWSPISLIPQLAPMHHSFHWSPISLVPRLIGPPSHWSPISLVPFSLVPQFISPPLHYSNSLVPLLIGPPFH